MSLIDKPWVKQPWEQLTHEFDMGKVQNSLALSGYILNAVTAIVEEQEEGTDVSLTMISGAASFVGNLVYITFMAGDSGKTYICRIRTTWTKAGSPNQQMEDEFIITVQETGRST